MDWIIKEKDYYCIQKPRAMCAAAIRDPYETSLFALSCDTKASPLPSPNKKKVVHRVRMIPALMSFMILVRTVGFFMWSCSACGLLCACCKMLCITTSFMIPCRHKQQPVSTTHSQSTRPPFSDTHRNLRIAHCTLHRLLLRFVCTLRADPALDLVRELLDLARAFRARRLVMLARNVEGLEGFGVLTQGKEHARLAYVCLDCSHGTSTHRPASHAAAAYQTQDRHG